MSNTSGSKNRRNRTLIACYTCRKGKRKCDGQQPICSLCQRYGKECNYAPEIAPRRNRIREMQDEVSILRQSIKELENGCSTDIRDLATRKSPTETQALGYQEIRTEAQDHERGFTNDIQGSTSAVKDFGTTDWKISSSDVENISSCGPMGVYSFQSGDLTPSPRKTFLRNVRADSIPALDSIRIHPTLYTQLVATFYDRVNRYQKFVDPLLPISPPSRNELLRVQFWIGAVLAAGCAFTNDPVTQTIGENLVDCLRMVALDLCVQHATNDVIQGLTILSWLEMNRGNDLQGWIYNSMAGGLVSHRGLHVLRPVEDTAKAEEVEGYKTSVRTFWTNYFVDRTASAVMGRIPTTHSRHLQTPSYCSLLQERKAVIEDVYFGHICDLWRLFDVIMDDIYTPSFRQLSAAARLELLELSRSNLFRLYSESSERLKIESSTPDELFCAYYFSIAYHTSLILLYRPFLSEVSDDRFANTLRTMAEAASNVCDIIQEHRKRSSFSHAPSSIVHHVTRSAVVFLLLATSKVEVLRCRAASELEHCLDALEETGHSWRYHSHKSIRLIQSLASRWGVVKILPSRFGGPLPVKDTEQGIFEPVIWRDQGSTGTKNATSGAICAQDITQMPALEWGDVLAEDFSWLADNGDWNLDNTLATV